MADGEYRRLGCVIDACEGNHKAHGYCLKHYRQWQRGGVKANATHCAHCSQEFQPSSAVVMYCSKQCKRKAWAAANPEKAHPPRLVSAFYAAYCKHCGDPFSSKRERAHCSNKCEHAARYAANPVSVAPSSRICTVCQKAFSPSEAASMQSRICSPDCVEQAANTHRRVNRLARKAKQRAVTVEPVDPIKVFQRDGWRCRLCGVKTPQAKRGSYTDDAPELDHIIPLSKGGDHSYRNTQCACRRCNGSKSDRPMGQMLLIG